MKSLNKLFALIAVAGLAMSTLSVQASNSEIILDQSVNDYTDAETYAGREDEGTYGSVHFVAKSILDEAVDDYSSVSTMSMGQDMERTEIAALKPISKERFDVTWELKVVD